MSGAGIGAVPIRSGMGINPFKGNTLSSTPASASASGSSPSLSIRQGLSSGLPSGGGGGSPLSTGFAGSFSRIQTGSSVGSSTRIGFPPTPSPIGSGFGYGAAPSSLGDRKGLGMGEREYRGRMSSESDRGEWDRDDRAGDSSRERDRLRRLSVGNTTSMPGYSAGAIEDAMGVPTRIPPTRKRYSSSFGNRYVGSGGSGAGGESGGSTPASVTAEGTDGGGGNGKGKEQSAAGVSLLNFACFFLLVLSFLTRRSYSTAV